MWTATFLVLISGLSSAGEPAGARAGWVELASGLPDRGQWRNGFDLADLDGDGRLDLVHAPARRALGPPTLFRATAEAVFERWEGTRFPNLPYDYGDAAAADFDGDGDEDLALGVHLKGIAVLSNDGGGRFSEIASFFDSEGERAFATRALAAGDVDGDGRPDLVAVGEGPAPPNRGRGASLGVRMLLNRLPEPWEWRELHPRSGRLFGDGVDLGDLDGDGHTDVAATSNVQNQSGVIFWGNGDGTFVAAELDGLEPRSFLEAVAIADFDGDGRPELALAGSDLRGSSELGAVDLLAATEDRRWSRLQLPWDQETGRPTALAAGDADGDGDLDLVALSSTGAVIGYVNADGALQPGAGLTSDEAGRGCRGYHAQLADLDGDGTEELLAGFAGEECRGQGALRAWRWSHRAPGRS